MTATALLNTVTLSQFTDLVDRIYLTGPQLIPRMASQLYIPMDLSAHTGNSRRFREVDTQTYARVKNEGEDATSVQAGVGYEKDMTMRRFAAEISITWEMRRLNKAPEVMAQLTSLSTFCPQRQELDLTHRFTFATATSYTDMDGVPVTTTTGDGLALVSASHTLTDSSSTYSNVITGNPLFSGTSLQVAESQGNTQILSNFGEQRVMNFNTIVTGRDPATVNSVKQLIDSTSDVDQNNPGVVNVYGGKYRHVILPYLDTDANGALNSAKSKYWGLLAVRQGTNGWQAYMGNWEQPNLKTPAPGNNGEDVHNDNWTYGTRCAYGIETISGRGLLWSTGVGA